MPRARSRARAPVEIASTAIVPFSPIFMTEPLPNCFSIWPSAISSAFSRSTVMSVSSPCDARRGSPCSGGRGEPRRSGFDDLRSRPASACGLLGRSVRSRCDLRSRGVTAFGDRAVRTGRSRRPERHQCNSEQLFDQGPAPPGERGSMSESRSTSGDPYGVGGATIDRAPINLMTSACPGPGEVQRTRPPVRRRDPAWWCCGPPTRSSSSPTSTSRPSCSSRSTGPALRPTSSAGFHRMCERFRTMPKVVDRRVAGRVGGGGAELSASCDMRFGALGRTIVNQMEVRSGSCPAAPAPSALPRLWAGRAMESSSAASTSTPRRPSVGLAEPGLAARGADPLRRRPRSAHRRFPPRPWRNGEATRGARRRSRRSRRACSTRRLFHSSLRTPEARAGDAALPRRGGQTREGELAASAGAQRRDLPTAGLRAGVAPSALRRARAGDRRRDGRSHGSVGARDRRPAPPPSTDDAVVRRP